MLCIVSPAKMSSLLFCFIVSVQLIAVGCWDTDEFEIFDLVEEVNKNFYEVLEVSKVNLRFKNFLVSDNIRF